VTPKQQANGYRMHAHLRDGRGVLYTARAWIGRHRFPTNRADNPLSTRKRAERLRGLEIDHELEFGRLAANNRGDCIGWLFSSSLQAPHDSPRVTPAPLSPA
jgi:hypothetical protein